VEDSTLILIFDHSAFLCSSRGRQIQPLLYLRLILGYDATASSSYWGAKNWELLELNFNLFYVELQLTN